MNSFDFSNTENLTNRRKNTTNLYKNMTVSKALGALHIGPAMQKYLEIFRNIFTILYYHCSLM